MSRDSRARLCIVLPGRGTARRSAFFRRFGTLPDSAPDSKRNPRLSSTYCFGPCKGAKGNEEGSEAGGGSNDLHVGPDGPQLQDSEVQRKVGPEQHHGLLSRAPRPGSPLQKDNRQWRLRCCRPYAGVRSATSGGGTGEPSPRSNSAGRQTGILLGLASRKKLTTSATNPYARYRQSSPKSTSEALWLCQDGQKMMRMAKM
jgi:hypothetical protein